MLCVKSESSKLQFEVQSPFKERVFYSDSGCTFHTDSE